MTYFAPDLKFSKCGFTVAIFTMRWKHSPFNQGSAAGSEKLLSAEKNNFSFPGAMGHRGGGAGRESWNILHTIRVVCMVRSLWTRRGHGIIILNVAGPRPNINGVFTLEAIWICSNKDWLGPYGQILPTTCWCGEPWMQQNWGEKQDVGSS